VLGRGLGGVARGTRQGERLRHGGEPRGQRDRDQRDRNHGEHDPDVPVECHHDLLSSDLGGGGPPYPPTAPRSSRGLDRACPDAYGRPASSSAARKSVLAPYSMSSMGVNSSSQWARPPRDGTKIMPAGPIAAMCRASWPAPARMR